MNGQVSSNLKSLSREASTDALGGGLNRQNVRTILFHGVKCVMYTL